MTKRSSTARSYPDRIPRIAVDPLAPTVLGECSAWSAAQEYSPGSAAGMGNVLARVSMWMQEVSVQRWMGAMRRFLASTGYLAATLKGPDRDTPAQAAVAEWSSWMRDQRGLTEKSIAAYGRYAAGLLDRCLAEDGTVQWDRLGASTANAYIADRGRHYGVVARAHVVGAVRSLLRWALSTGRLDRDLTAGILKAPGTKRSMPRGVDTDQVAALLAVCDPATPIGARDRALVLVLVRLGLRAGEAARLMLDDIDWASGLLKVTGKGREHVLPVPIDVGQALEAWLRVRP